MTTNPERDSDLHVQRVTPHRHPLPPIDLLPTEILTNIFVDACVLLKGNDCIDPTRLPFRIQLTHVSHAWRAAALGCAAIWTTIYVRTHTPVDQLQFIWTNTRGAPVDMEIRFVGSGHNDVLVFISNKIQESPQRFRSITSSMPKRDYAVVFHSPHCRLENLKTLNVYAGGSGERPGALIGSIEAPSLRNIKVGAEIGLPWNSKLLMLSPYLSTFASDNYSGPPSIADWTDMLEGLERKTSLQDLTLVLPYRYAATRWTVEGRNTVPDSKIPLPNARSISVSCHSLPAVVQFLKSIRVSLRTMASLSIRCPAFNWDAPAILWSSIHTALSCSTVYPEEVCFSWGVVHCRKVRGMLTRDPSGGEVSNMGVRIVTTDQYSILGGHGPERLFESALDYQDAFSFECLVSMTLDSNTRIPDALWCLLGHSPTLRVIEVKDRVPLIFLAVLDGSCVDGTNAATKKTRMYQNHAWTTSRVDLDVPQSVPEGWVPFPALEMLSLAHRFLTISALWSGSVVDPDDLGEAIANALLKREDCIRSRRRLMGDFDSPRLTLVINQSTEEDVEELRTRLGGDGGCKVRLGTGVPTSPTFNIRPQFSF